MHSASGIDLRTNLAIDQVGAAPIAVIQASKHGARRYRRQANDQACAGSLACRQASSPAAVVLSTDSDELQELASS
jgi:hypothetical protein